MNESKHIRQNITKLMDDESVLMSLVKQPKRFKDLIIETKLSQTGLSAILKRLQSDDKIKKIIYNNHESYKITDKGQDFIKGICITIFELYDIQNSKAVCENNYLDFRDIKYS